MQAEYPLRILYDFDLATIEIITSLFIGERVIFGKRDAKEFTVVARKIAKRANKLPTKIGHYDL